MNSRDSRKESTAAISIYTTESTRHKSGVGSEEHGPVKFTPPRFASGSANALENIATARLWLALSPLKPLATKPDLPIGVGAPLKEGFTCGSAAGICFWNPQTGTGRDSYVPEARRLKT